MKMKTYSLKELDSLNCRRYKVPNLPKFATLIEFANRVNQSNTQMNRNSFGQQAPKTIFKAATSVDDLVKCRINELMSKVTEQNLDELMDQFKNLPFSEITEYQRIANTVHFGIINCQKYHQQFVPLIEYLSSEHPVFVDYLKRSFMEFGADYGERSVGLDTEEKYMLKKKLMGNFEMVTLLRLKGIILTDQDLLAMVERLEQSDDESMVELLIRLLKCIQEHGIPVWPDKLERLSSKVDAGNYSRMIKFLVMDLE